MDRKEQLERWKAAGLGQTTSEDTELATFTETFISLEEMQAMTEEERAYFGLTEIYLFALEHQTPE